MALIARGPFRLGRRSC